MSTNKINLALVFGGVSSEYEISLLSATSILNNIDTSRYNIYMIGISKAGEFFLYNGDISRIAKDTWQGDDCVSCIISPDRSHHGILILGEKTVAIKLDCIFPVLHGRNGEDGTIQGLLELSNITYVGCGVLASSVCMDKAFTKAMLDSKKIENSKWTFTTRNKYMKNPSRFLDKVQGKLGFPCFIKPANAGSSVGITKATDIDSFTDGMEKAFIHDEKVVVEQSITGIELECAVLGNNSPIASCLGEITPSDSFYDYDAKYNSKSTKTYVPARVNEEIANQTRAVAIKAYSLLNCSGLARVDFFLTPNNEIILNEINTLPGFTSISMYPQLFAESGIPYSELINRLIDLAINNKRLGE